MGERDQVAITDGGRVPQVKRGRPSLRVVGGPPEVFDVAQKPRAVLAKIDGSINRRSRRALGVIKTEKEYVGVVTTDAFEIWERNQRAVHAVGQVRSRAGLTRIEVRYLIPPPARLIIGVFFGLYAAVAFGVATRAPEPWISVLELAVIAAGAAILVTGFWYAARRQRDDLAAFIAGLL